MHSFFVHIHDVLTVHDMYVGHQNVFFFVHIHDVLTVHACMAEASAVTKRVSV